MTGNDPSPRSNCLNCGQELTGRFCAACGQEDRPIDVSVGEFLRDAFGEIFSFDSRAFRTFGPLMLRPGQVAQQYNAGHRARFVPPLRLYILVSFILFFVMAVAPDVTVVNITVNGEAVDSLEQITEEMTADSVSGFEQQVADAIRDQDQLDRRFLQRLSQVMFVLVPWFALLLKVTHRRHPYVHHLVYAMYFHVFVFLILLLQFVPVVLGVSWLGPVTGVLLLYIPVYFYLGQRRLYTGSRLATLGKSGFVLLAYLLSLIVAMWFTLILTVLI